MNSTKLLTNIQSQLKLSIDKYPIIHKCLEAIWENSGKAYLVGGAVRDLLLDLPINDFDIEIHNIQPNELLKILKEISEVNYVGKSFGVIKMAHFPIDWSLPRSDSSGRKPLVDINPNLPIEIALKRRDLTMNAMAINLYNYELIDPFNGYQHIKNKILNAPDVAFFAEDPLRFYRVMQFIGRFEMFPDKELTETCKKIDISNVSIERKEQEFDKLLLKSKRPSLGIRWLKEIGKLKEILPELYNTIGIPQEYSWHPEGDVFEHLMQALDASTTIICDSEKDNLTLRYAALCHDLGKTTTTKKINYRIHSYGHDIAGVPLASSMMKRITHRIDLINSIKVLVKNHMMPGQFVSQKSSSAAYKRLSIKLAPYENLNMLSKLFEADLRGRNGSSDIPLNPPMEKVDKFIEYAKKANVLYRPEEAILKGKDIADIVPPGPIMGDILKAVYKKQIEYGINNKQELKEIALNIFKSKA